MKSVVCYFSATGTTKKVAVEIAADLQAELVEIVPEVPYSEADLNWHDQNSRSSVEMNDKAFRPKIQPPAVDITQYDVILLGFPIWWYVPPTVVNTFLEGFDLAGKKIYLFATSGGSPLDHAAKALAASTKGAELIKGRVLTPFHKDEIKAWLESAGLL